MTMSVNRAFVEENQAATARIVSLTDRLSDEELQRSVGAHWTVAITLAHLAFWDRRVLLSLEESERVGKLVVPEVHLHVNDISLPLWAAIPAREAARLAVEAAQAVDERLAAYPAALLAEAYAHNQRWVRRAIHRHSHLDEIDAALGGNRAPAD